MINKIKIILLFLCCSLGTGQLLQGQNIRMFFYAPDAAINSNFTGATAAYINADRCSGDSTGYSYVLLDATTAPIFRTMAPPGIRQTYDSLTTASSLMRTRILQISGLSNGLVNDIEMHLFDDRTGLIASDSCKCDNLFGATRGLWACASNFKRSDGRYLGYVYFGELAANHIINNFDGGWWAWNETVIHEFSHTQFAAEYNSAGTRIANKWGRNGISISYGGDAGHWGEELQADQQSPLDEGLATFWGMESNRVGRDSLVSWLNQTDERMILGSHSFLTGTPAMWDAPHNVIWSGTIPANRTVTPPGWNPIRLVSPHIQTGAGYELREYKWLDVPGKYVFYNEKMFQAFAMLFHENAMVQKDSAFAMMLRSAKKMTPPNNRLRYPALLANALANELEAYAGTAAGRADETNNALVSSMFVYALFDIVTHFGMSESDLRREFTINMATYVPVPKPQAFDNYWAHRAALKQRVCPFLGGSSCSSGAGTIDIVRAVQEAKTYFSDSSRILR